jgi:hypothetical protein
VPQREDTGDHLECDRYIEKEIVLNMVEKESDRLWITW